MAKSKETSEKAGASLDLHPRFSTHYDSEQLYYHSVRRQTYLDNGKSEKKSAARYALRFVQQNKDRLAEMDIADVSFALEDLAGGYIYDKRSEQREAIKILCEAGMDKIRGDAQLQDIPLFERESYLSVIGFYRKFIRRRLPDDLYKIEQMLKNAVQTPSALSLTINQDAADKKFFRLRIDEIEEAAAAYFRAAREYPKKSSEYQKERKQGNIQISIACAKYLKDNISSEEDWEQLTVRELVFLHKNLRKSRKDSRLSDILAAKCEARLKTAEARIDGGAGLESEEIEAFKNYCRYRLSDYKKQNDENALLQTAFYQSLLRKLDRAAAKPATVQEKPEQLPEAGKPQQSLSATDNKLAQQFEKACEKREIRFNKTEDAENHSLQYDLYSPQAEKTSAVSGRLTIGAENNVSLWSEEFEHFVALAEAAKAGGSPSLIIGELSPDPTEAKKFAAKLVLAGYVAKIEVQHSFDMAELAKIDPEIGKMQELKRLKAEINKAKERKQQAKEENREKATQDLREKSAAYQRYIIEHGDIYDTRTPEEKQKAFDERTGRRQHGKNSTLSPAAAQEIRRRATTRR